MLFIIHLMASASLAWGTGFSLLSGGLAAFALLYVLARLLGLGVQRLSSYTRSLELGVGFCLWFIGQILLASYQVACLVLARRVEVAPAVLAYPVARRSASTATLLGALLTLTPGTLALEYDESRGLLYIHVLDAHQREEVTQMLGELERRLLAWLDAGKAQGATP